VIAPRVLFEGLEHRILPSGLPADVLALLPRITETYTVQVTNQQPAVLPPVGAWTPFTLPKFNDQGGTRELVSVEMHFSSVVEQGLREFDNSSPVAGTLTLMALGAQINLDSPAEPTFNFATSPAAIVVDVPIGPNQDGFVQDWDPTEIDYASISAAGVRDTPAPVVHEIPDDLSRFIAVPGDDTIGFRYASGSITTYLTDGITPTTRFNPPLRFGFNATVIYAYVGFTWDVYDDYRGGAVDVERPLPSRPIQPLYSGTAEPGATLAVDVYSFQGEQIGSRSVAVDAGGNWSANFPDTDMTGQPHTVRLRQAYAGYSPYGRAGYNLRRYYSPAQFGGAYAVEHLTVEDVAGKRTAYESVESLWSATVDPLAMGWQMYSYELLPSAAMPAGI